MRFLISIILILIYSSSFSQLSKENEHLLDSLLSEQINSLRKEKGLPPLRYNENLKSAAILHSKYMAETNKLSHDESKPEASKPNIRVRLFTDEFEFIGENILYTQFKNKSINIEDIKKMAIKMALMWKNSRKHYETIISPKYINTGIGFCVSKNGKIYATQVFGRKGIKIRGQSSKNAFGIKTFGEKCDELLANKGNLLVNLGNSVQVHDDKVYLMYHNKKIVDKIISDKNDGFAVDILLKDQFNCGIKNQLDMSVIYDGILLKPFYRDSLLSNNIAKNEHRFISKIGEIPKTYSTDDYQINLIVIKDGAMCSYTVPTFIPSKQYELIEMKPIIKEQKQIKFKTEGIIATDEFIFNFNRDDTIPINKTKSQNKYSQVFSVDIKSYSSVEGKTEDNIKLHNKRAEFIKNYIVDRVENIPDSVFHIQASENWDLCYYQLELLGQSDLANMQKNEISNYINKNINEWDRFLTKQRKSYASIKYKGSWLKSDSMHYYRNLETALNESNFDLANNAMAKIYSNKQSPLILLNKSIMEKLLKYSQLTQNASALLSMLPNKYLEYKIVFLRQWINNSSELNADTKYNLLILYATAFSDLLKKWDLDSSMFSRIINPNKISKILPKNSFNSKANSVILNYHLLAVSYYGQTNNGSGIDKSFKYIINHFEDIACTMKDYEKLSLFFNSWSRYDLTNNLLLKKFKEPKFSEDAAFILAHTSSAYSYYISEEQLFKITKKAFDLNKNRWCRWMSNEFQNQRHNKIKLLYCRNCK